MVSKASDRPIEILLVEDNPGDVLLTREALAEGKLRHNLAVAENGDEALAYLHRTGKHAGVPPVDLILLDLNLPGKDGREVLAEIKRDDRLRRIPVVVLTTSRAECDILKSYDLDADGYIVKPVSVSQILKIIAARKDFGLAVVKVK